MPVDPNSRSVDTLDRNAPIIRIITPVPNQPPTPGENINLKLTVKLETISPSLLLADLKGEMESHRRAFIGQVVAVRSDGRPTFSGSVDTVGVLVEAVLKGDIAPGIHWFVDRVQPWGLRYTGLAGRRMLWFRNRQGVEGPMDDLRQDGTVRPPSPCGGPISGHPILPDGRVTRGGSYEEFGVGVPLSIVLDAFRGVGIRRADRPAGVERGLAGIRGGGGPVLLFNGGITGRRGGAVSADGRRHLPGRLAP
jgi:hypothetical protein